MRTSFENWMVKNKEAVISKFEEGKGFLNDESSLVFVYLEGCLMVNDSDNQVVKDLLNDTATVMLKN